MDNSNGNVDDNGRDGEWTHDITTDGFYRGRDPRRNPYDREWRPRRGADERMLRAFFAGAFWSAAAAAALLFAGVMFGAVLAARMGWRL